MWFLQENCRGVKIVTCLDISQGIVRTSVLPSLPFPVGSLSNAVLLPSAWVLHSQGDAWPAPSSSNHPSLETQHCLGSTVGTSPRGQRGCSSPPWLPKLPLPQWQTLSFKKYVLFLAAKFPKPFLFTLSVGSNVSL